MNKKTKIETAFKIAEELEEIFAETNKTSCPNCPNRGCCKRCAEETGFYPRWSTIGQKDYLLMRSCFKFSEKTGFFSEEGKIGCSIPRVLRSSVCLTFICDDIINTLKPLSKKETKKYSTNHYLGPTYRKITDTVDNLILMRKKHIKEIIKKLQGGSQ